MIAQSHAPAPPVSGGLKSAGKRKAGSPNQPVVTVVTSVLNGEQTLEETIQSVLQQTYPNVEYIIVDGASKDGTVALLSRYSDSIDYWISEPDRGIYDAWNKGLGYARGDWVIFVGADDQLTPTAIESLVNAALKDAGPADFVCGKVEMLRDGQVTRTIGAAWSWRKFRRYMSIAHSGGMHRAEYFKRFGRFDSSYRICGDYELLLRAGQQLKVVFVDTVVTRMRMGGVSNANDRVFRESVRARMTHGLCTPRQGRLDAAWARAKWQVRRLLGR